MYQHCIKTRITLANLYVAKKCWTSYCLVVVMTGKNCLVLVLTLLLTLIIFKWEKSRIILLPFETNGVVKLYCLRTSLKDNHIHDFVSYSYEISTHNVLLFLNKLKSFEVLNATLRTFYDWAFNICNRIEKVLF